MKKKGQLLWFAAQFILLCAMLASPFAGQFECPPWLRLLGLGIVIAGITVTVLGARTLGKSLTPRAKPIEGGQLVTTGIYHHLRHPIYAGYILGGFGWALLTCSLFGVGVAIAVPIFVDLKSREEEKWLTQKYANYATYKSKVKKFIPGIY